jgi:hypothetical protein
VQRGPHDGQLSGAPDHGRGRLRAFTEAALEADQEADDLERQAPGRRPTVTLDLDAELAELLEVDRREAETRRVLERLQGRLVAVMRVELDAAADELVAVAATPARPLVDALVRALRVAADGLEQTEGGG